jgi:hypothetical protein
VGRGIEIRGFGVLFELLFRVAKMREGCLDENRGAAAKETISLLVFIIILIS